MCHQPWVLLLPITMLLALVGAQTSSTTAVSPTLSACIHGISTPGVTVPRGDIVLENGTQLELYCIMDTTHGLAKDRDARNMKFYKNHSIVPSENIEIINSTTIRLVEIPEPSVNIYKCKLENKDGSESFVCLNKVTVGYKPRQVLNFSCISENWKSLNCSWKEQENPIRTQYKLTFRLPGRAGGRNYFMCPGNTESLGYCYWHLESTPPYRRPYEYYYFHMIGENKLGRVTFGSMQFHHYAHVVPEKPHELTYQNVTHNSVYLKWKIQDELSNFPPGFFYKINYKTQCDPSDKWMSANTTGLQKNVSGFNLTDLQYANEMYDVRLYMQSRAAVGEDRWSQPAFVTFRTRPTVPGAAPRTDIGSFKIIKRHHERDIVIFWQQIPKCEENGEDFHYEVISVEEKGQRKQLNYTEIGKSHVRFTGLSFNSYRFEIISANREGYSKESSVVYVPNKTESPPEPAAFTKHVNEKGIIRLSWKTVTDKYWADKIQNYTIFWCQNDREDPNHCTGFLNWTRVSKDVMVKDIPVIRGKIYEFAISSNTESASSGMLWASCTVRPNSGLQEVKSFYIKAIGSSSIQVVFHLECINSLRDDIFYSIYYCQVVSPNDSTCKEPVKNTFVKSDTGEILKNITNLQPYTTYIVYIAPVVINNGDIIEQGESSIALRNTTFEAAPTLPLNVVVRNVTNQSMTVEWSPPLHMNGVLRYYEVYINDRKINVKPQDGFKLQVLNLTSYTNYNVSVSACTVECSNKTVPVVVRTAVGAPGIITNIDTTVHNSSKIKIKWKPPAYRGGDVNGYEIKVISSANPNTTKIYNFSSSDEPHAVFQASDCQDNIVSYKLSIRAFNEDNDTNIFHGPWSEARDAYCTPKEPVQKLKIFIWVLSVAAMTIILIGIVYGLKRFITWCSVAKKVEVILPAGLAPSKDDDKDDLNIVSWPLNNDHDHLGGKTHSAADEQMLLQKKDGWHTRKTSRDTSGCSSGHESVSSSLTAGTNVSTDSGAEVDQNAQSLEVFTESLSWEIPSAMSQQNLFAESDNRTSINISITESTPMKTDNNESMNRWYSRDYRSVPSGGESYISMPINGDIQHKEMGDSYCVISLDKLQSQPLNKGYVTMACNSSGLCDTTSSGNYISHEVPWKKPVRNLCPASEQVLNIPDDDCEDPVPLSELQFAEETEETTEDVMQANIMEAESAVEDNQADSRPVSPVSLDGAVHLPETYCRIGLQSSPNECSLDNQVSPIHDMPDSQKEQKSQQITVKSNSDYVSLEELSRLSEVSASSKEDVQSLGYVPYQCFEERDNVSPVSTIKCRGESKEQYVQVNAPVDGRQRLDFPTTCT